ncbi:TetR/AcrR family transcriptional regulator [Kribbella solani]|uniref:AcrR family transcriptional regulator n=1 Tax=Kribbella solani TaxID=236067 RepID=A0A841DK46_9ACTN|nr:TetR/AcrR family transcriptional regulator C-terminal domain-containing protein [Kribbella solani]MBB5978271.1 AcrR family transcriptional regulator [Kribbella solani]
MATDEYTSVWTRPKRGRRREQPALTQEQIVTEAIRLLDADGLEALTMRKLGAALGAVATAVYWHVANKDELLELVVDHVSGEVEVPEVTDRAEWRPAAEAAARNVRAMIVRHPWMAPMLAEVGMNFLGPNLLRTSDAMLGVYLAAGFELAEADQASKTVLGYVIGIASVEAATISKLKRGGLDMATWQAEVWPAAVRATEPYPRLRALYAANSGSDLEAGGEDTFSYGLNSILDGLEARSAAK